MNNEDSEKTYPNPFTNSDKIDETEIPEDVKDFLNEHGFLMNPADLTDIIEIVAECVIVLHDKNKTIRRVFLESIIKYFGFRCDNLRFMR